MTEALLLFVGQGLLGAADTFWYHEYRLRLASEPGARFELRLHAIRTAIYALLYAMLAWGEWRGALAGIVASLLASEIVITMWDFVEEDRTRRLPAGERVMHGILAVLYGAFLAIFLPILWTWAQQPLEIVPGGHPVLRAALAAMALGALGSGLRDLLASRLPVDGEAA